MASVSPPWIRPTGWAFREWSLVSAKRNPAVMLDQASLPWFAELNRGLNDVLDDAQFRARVRASTEQLRTLAEMIERACGEHPGLASGARRALPATGGRVGGAR